MPRGGYRPGAGRPRGSKNLIGQKKVKLCIICGAEVGSHRWKYCSDKCIRTDARNKAKSKRFEAKCLWCGKVFIRGGEVGGWKKFCSAECREEHYEKSKARYKEKKCIQCGKLFMTSNDSACCSLKCASAIKSKKAKEQWPTYICKRCGKMFHRKKDSRKMPPLYCSRKCAKIGIIGERKTKRYGFNGGDHRHRAKLYGVKYESIRIIEVFKRDGWKCQICGKETPKKNRGTRYANAPELDHRIPMSKGGGHLYSNVQCACHRCNAKKGNMNGDGQLPLFEIK